VAWAGEYHKLVVWQKGMDFADAVYDATERWPRYEQVGPRSQARRAAFSIPANVAEGQGRFGQKEFLHHLSIAYGSLNEAETAVQFGRRRGFLEEAELDHLMGLSGEVGRLLLALMKGLRASVGDK
jgi:four helix bundle protein